MRLHSPHRFPLDLETYVPLSDAIAQLGQLIDERDRGYVAIVGPPGTGKSTLLSQAISGTKHRCIRYYAYIPGTDAARNRLTGQSFLHDVVHELRASGLQGQDRELTSDDPIELRRQRAELLDAAHQEFRESGRRTIIVVDGLDHVEREYPGNEGLLSELPRRDELPDGVLLVVGTRMLSPLQPEVRQQLEDEGAIVDLSQHPLTPQQILDLCVGAPGVSDFGGAVHQLLVERSAGHPLSLSYLLNRIRDEPADSACEILESAPAYTGDIAAAYRVVWESAETDDALVRIFSMCSRLRIGFRPRWLNDLLSGVPLGQNIVQRFARDFRYLFRIENDEWSFFHDSFRQFVGERTAVGPNGESDPEEETNAHRFVADFCARSDDPRLADEELYHRHLGLQDDKVLTLASQTGWRWQFRNLRSPFLIRSDMELVLQVAASRGDVVAMLGAMLGLAELQSRISVLEGVDLPEVLLRAGLTEEAIDWCSGKNPAVLLAHRYNLAWLLGREAHSAGRRLFDSNEHLGFDEPNGQRVAGHLHDAALAWTRAASIFRPILNVIQSIENVVEELSESDQDVHSYFVDESRSRYLSMMRELIEASLDSGDRSKITAIDLALERRLALFASSNRSAKIALGDERSRRAMRRWVASLVALRVQAAQALCALDQDTVPIARAVGSFLSDSKSLPTFPSTLLNAAELLADSGLSEPAESLLARTEHTSALTAADLGFDRRDRATVDKYRYWRLRYRLATSDDLVPESTSPAPETPAGDRISPDAPIHRDIESIRFAERMDALLRSLARIDAATIKGERKPVNHIWPVMLEALEVVPASRSRGSVSRSGYPLRAPGLLRTVADLAIGYGGELPQRLSNELRRQFRDHSVGWLATPLLDVLCRLKLSGVDVKWEAEVLAVYDESAAQANVNQKVEEVADLIPHLAMGGLTVQAEERARELPGMAFSVGFRKDYQCDEWVSWYTSAAADSDAASHLSDGSWLAQLLRAVEPMTEGAPGQAANGLPRGVSTVEPAAAVRVFEYFVRNGTVSHFDGLAAIVQALVEQSSPGNANAATLAADVTAHLISAGAGRAYPELARAIIASMGKAAGPVAAGELAESIAARTDRFALPADRIEWHQGLGLVTDRKEEQDDDDFHALVLKDGRRIAPRGAVDQIKAIDDVVRWRDEESNESHFPWLQAIRQLDYEPDLVERLVPLFRGAEQRELDVQLFLAETAERNGDFERAHSLANDAFKLARGNSWTTYMGRTRLRCAAIRVRLSDEQERVRICVDLGREVIGNPSLSQLLIYDLGEIAQVLNPNLRGNAMWPLFREYLEGIAEPLELGSDDPLADHGSRWWSQALSADNRNSCASLTASEALAELVVGHLAHPSWIVSDAAITVIAQALGRSDEDVAQALARFAGPETSHDLLERAGRCLAAARNRFGVEVPPCLETLDLTLAGHPSQVLRDLGSRLPRRANRALAHSYRLATIGAGADPIDPAFALDDPYRVAYRLLALGLPIEEQAIVRVAERYAKKELTRLPTNADIQSALKSAIVEHRYPLPEAAARRAAYGHVLGDIYDAGALDTAPDDVRQMLRTVDIDLIGRVPDPRPETLPGPPAAGHDQTAERWAVETGERLQEYVQASVTGQRTLIGARVDLEVLNWGYLEEEFLCGTTIGAAESNDDEHLFESQRSMILSDLKVLSDPQGIYLGDPLVIGNSAFRFQQLQAHWLAFRPDFATALGWSPEESRPGTWYTASGEVAVERVWWVDGWWGRTSRSFDDTAAMGHAVLLTTSGLAAVIAALGPITRHFRLIRQGREDGEDLGSKSARTDITISSA